MALSFTLVDDGFQLFQQRTEELGNARLEVGIFDDGELATIAAAHEYGTDHVPERSFMRSTFRDKQWDIAAFMAKAVERCLAGRITPKAALELIGMFVTNAIKGTIVEGAGVPPPLKPATIARKGSARPLVDTGRMLNAITWKVVP